MGQKRLKIKCTITCSPKTGPSISRGFVKMSRREEIKGTTTSQRRARYEAWKIEQRALTLEGAWDDGCLEPERGDRVSLQKAENVPFL